MQTAAKKQILYVDDETQALKLFARLFCDRFNIATAESVDAAIEYLRKNGDDIGVVITDQRMPSKTGNVLLEHLRHHYPSIVRILTTAYSDLSAAITAVNDGGAFRYITKPWNETEVAGALKQALEYHHALDERDRLLREKLTVLHRLIVMDRVRGLATAATALEGRIRNAWRALTAYMAQSPVVQRMRIDMDEIAGLNMAAIARREGENMIKTVQLLLKDVLSDATGVEPQIDAHGVLNNFLNANRNDLNSEDVSATISGSGPCHLETDRGLLAKLVALLVRRLIDGREEPMKLALSASTSDGGAIRICIRGDFPELANGHLSSFFSAAIPLQKWPMGLDMDLLSAFMLAHHLGGELKIVTHPPLGPGFEVQLPKSWTPTAGNEANPAWFDSVFETIECWEEDIAKSSDDRYET